MEKTIASLLVVGLAILLAVSFVSKANPTGDIISKPEKVCNPGEVKDVKQVNGELGVKLYQYTLCSESSGWTGPHVSSNLPG